MFLYFFTFVHKSIWWKWEITLLFPMKIALIWPFLTLYSSPPSQINCLHHFRPVSLLIHVKIIFMAFISKDINNRFIYSHRHTGNTMNSLVQGCTQIARFMGPTWGPSGSCRPQMGPMLAPWTLLSGVATPLLTRRHRSFYEAINTTNEWRIYMRATGQVLYTDVKCL